MSHDYDPAFDAPEEPEIVELEFPQGGTYEAHWYLSDLYPENEEILRKAWDTPGLNFRAQLSCKKEIHYATVERVEGVTTIRATSCLDDLEDLVDTCIWQACGGNDYSGGGWDAIGKIFDLDPDADHDEIYKRLDEVCVSQAEDYTGETQAEVVLPAGATWDEFIKALDTAEYKADTQADAYFKDLIESVKTYMAGAWGLDYRTLIPTT